MRAALISLAAQPRLAAGGAQLAIAGKTLAERQLEFALAAGCERIVALGDGASPDSISLSHVAEAAGAQFQAIAGIRGLLGTARSGDELLVLAPGLLPEARPAVEALAGAPVVLVLPGPSGAAAGFERIDVERAWAGAMVVPGALVEKLTELPPDAEAAPALLRIALQAKVKERALDPTVLVGGAWAMIGADGLPAAERAWLDRYLARAGRFAPSEQVAAAVLGRFHAHILNSAHGGGLLAGACALMLGLAALISWLGHAAVGFAVLAAAVVTGSVAIRLARLRGAPFRSLSQRRSIVPAALVDITLAVCAAFAIDGDWLHKAFPSLVLVAGLRVSNLGGRSNGLALLADRAVVALILTLAAAIGLAEPAIMGLALIVIALATANSAASRG